MKKDLASLLKCPACGQSSWRFSQTREDAREIREGSLACESCGAVYSILDGILDMLGELAPEVAHEKKHAEAHSYLRTANAEYPINRETLERFRSVFLSLPAGDGSDLFKPGGSFDNQGGNAERFFKTLEFMKLTGEETILEVGASFGWASWRFAQKGCRVVALEVSNYLQAADLYFDADGAYFDRLMGDMNRLPFADQSFDIIFSHSVIHHCKDLKTLFSEFARVLRPGGRVVALHECAFGIFEDKSGKALQEAIDEGFNENAYTLPQWCRGAKDGGFRSVKLHFFSFIDDYVYRKNLRGSRDTWKLRLAQRIQAMPALHGLLNGLSAIPRILLRPKAWMMTAYR
ncbi:MAG TPA: methyltransferase domain-containing protein [Verrucomicrobiae bacterium]|jgi:SAM-dependent methyltransferase|nr:methyltransferase domain-containing protein [Verrucomicrobiae bacterium]